MTMAEAESSGARQAIIDLVAGSLGGVSNVYVGQPLDTIKVKLQTFPHLYRGATQCGINTFKAEGTALILELFIIFGYFFERGLETEVAAKPDLRKCQFLGIRGLYAGTVPSLVANVAENAVLFLAYGAAQNLVSQGVGKQQKELSTLENACAGSLASIASGRGGDALRWNLWCAFLCLHMRVHSFGFFAPFPYLFTPPPLMTRSHCPDSDRDDQMSDASQSGDGGSQGRFLRRSSSRSTEPHPLYHRPRRASGALQGSFRRHCQRNGGLFLLFRRLRDGPGKLCCAWRHQRRHW